MSLTKQPKTLVTLCLNNISTNMSSYWFREDSEIKRIIDSTKVPLYLLGSPFENINDDQVDYILKKLYAYRELKCEHMILLFHYRTKKIDLSFITHKKISLVNSFLSHFVGNICFNLTELNLRCHFDLKPADLCHILSNMKNLKHLNLAHTKANIDVARLISANCLKLEYLNLENCRLMFEYCIEIMTDNLCSTLTYLDIDNINISKELVENILFKCRSLRYFQVNNLADVVHKLYFNSITQDEPMNRQVDLKLKMFSVNPETLILKPEVMNSINESCPNLKILHIMCTGLKSSLSNIGNFKNLSELLIANQSCMISYQFGGHFIEALKGPLGRQLKALHLVHITDVNMKSIAKYCPNLMKLNIEFLGYYEPAEDDSGELDKNNNENFTNLCIPALRILALTNSSTKLNQVHNNIDRFKSDIKLLLRNGKVNFLELGCFNELDDEYFRSLFATMSNSGNFLYENIATLNLYRMENISISLIFKHFFKQNKNNLKSLDLNDCKNISRKDFFSLQNWSKANGYDCEIKWK